jgi:hypothetical protein
MPILDTNNPNFTSQNMQFVFNEYIKSGTIDMYKKYVAEAGTDVVQIHKYHDLHTFYYICTCTMVEPRGVFHNWKRDQI